MSDASAVGVKSFPVPLKSFDCLAALVQVQGLVEEQVPEKEPWLAAVTVNVAVDFAPPG